MIENKKVEVKTVGEHRPGDVCELKVVRQNEMGAFLDAGTGNTSDDILLHKQQQDSRSRWATLLRYIFTLIRTVV